MISVDEFRRLKARADEAKAEADRAEGALNQLMSKLEEEYNCSSLDEAQKKIDELECEEEKLENQYNKVLTEFREKWGDML